MKIICIGRNYVAHIEELHHKQDAIPLFFFKPDTSLTQNNEPFYLPDFAEKFDYECELVVKINRVGKCIGKQFAKNYYNEVALGLDFTARDIQMQEIASGLPWTLSKTFDYSAPVSKFFSLKELQKEIQNLNFSLIKNGHTVQSTNTTEMIFSVDELISYISQFITLKTGDLIFTGTPSGVGKITKGDILEGYLEGKKLLDIKIK
ncbi:MAG: fumarylacetoacetate hydrolase family protein [Bacteroidales bacterium]|jgi:2-keto-4-pentenoate hydratase/2-oxohepta-3-ene-1,7-dioic acid hydratase in catechol pathway|nr:fumarylacetoacetate hydrolase family protein [Bacteroidales bacterium]